ncbi:hypothetical protein PPYR_06104 [Photinus pyralis]|uniref:CRAL-TRIO domain-containing protein n=2 Tax=Photinus pyralis TaxID=7054 RepID=A0A5N4ASP0_PHOPY|nr:clavesin-1-like [Photinus pyralis]KAB0800364.1 hypothetical protein PPYR_06104 [Photinus pyralis]
MSVRILSKELQLIAETELNEVANRVNDDIQSLREWLKSQRHLKARTDDQWLLTCLRGSKFSLERTKEKIDRYYTARTLCSEFYAVRDPFSLDIQRCFDDGIVFVLPVRECEPIRLVFRVGTVDTRIVSFETRVKVFTMIIDALLEEYDELAINGLSLLFDSAGITYDHLAQVTLPLLKKCALCFLDSYPIRLEALHVINIVPIARTLKQLALQFVPKKLRTSVFLYDDNAGGDDIYEHFPRDLLPPEYGGTGKPIEELAAQLKLKVESYKDWYALDRTFCTDESKRPQESTLSQELFGLDGSFRKLDID